MLSVDLPSSSWVVHRRATAPTHRRRPRIARPAWKLILPLALALFLPQLQTWAAISAALPFPSEPVQSKWRATHVFFGQISNISYDSTPPNTINPRPKTIIIRPKTNIKEGPKSFDLWALAPDWVKHLMFIGLSGLMIFLWLLSQAQNLETALHMFGIGRRPADRPPGHQNETHGSNIRLNADGGTRANHNQLNGSEAFDRLPHPVLSSPRTIRIFLASSSELVEDRNSFDLFCRQENDRLLKQGLYLQVFRWEHFLDAMSETRLQDEYNSAIRSCDVFVSLFKTRTGKFTEEEFFEAHRSFRASGKPLIYTYFMRTEVPNDRRLRASLNSLWDFQEKLSELGHFHSEYANIQDLQLQFRRQLDKLIDERKL
jgi:hypothetical protein